jgi:hypothetical protein
MDCDGQIKHFNERDCKHHPQPTIKCINGMVPWIDLSNKGDMTNQIIKTSGASKLFL